MKVKDFIKDIDGRIYLGSSTAYVAIGDSKEILDSLPEINHHYLTNLNNRLSVYQDVIRLYPEKIVVQTEKVDALKMKVDSSEMLVANGQMTKKSFEALNTEYLSENGKLKDMQSHLSYARFYTPKIKEYIKNWKDFEDREILDTYPVNTVNHGTVVVCEGKEAGKYWLTEEWERDHKKNGK